MRFLSSLAAPIYVIVPTDFGYMPGGTRRVVRGLRAEFKGHMFDTERAQKGLRWSDDERKLVEQSLLEHEDFERGRIMALRPGADPEGRKPRLYLADGPDAARLDTDVTPAPEQKPRCIFLMATDEGAEQCSRPAKADGIYCAQHEKIAAKAGAAA
jgi:hypothetical protein